MDGTGLKVLRVLGLVHSPHNREKFSLTGWLAG